MDKKKKIFLWVIIGFLFGFLGTIMVPFVFNIPLIEIIALIVLAPSRLFLRSQLGFAGGSIFEWAGFNGLVYAIIFGIISWFLIKKDK